MRSRFLSRLRPRNFRSMKAHIPSTASYPHSGAILIVEDDPEVGGLLGRFLEKAGYQVSVAADGRKRWRGSPMAASCPISSSSISICRGRSTASRLSRESSRSEETGCPPSSSPATLSTSTLQQISGQNCFHLIKPVKADALLDGSVPCCRMLPPQRPRRHRSGRSATTTVARYS